MNIDPIQILYVTLYSKITNEIAKSININSQHVFFISIVFCLYKIINIESLKIWFDQMIINKKQIISYK